MGRDRAAVTGTTVSRSSRVLDVATAAVPLAFVTVLVVVPVVAVLDRGLDAGTLLDVFRRPALREVLWFSLWQALLSTALTVLGGLPLAAVLARRRFRGDGLVAAAVTAPFVLPTVVVAGAYVVAFDRLGVDPVGSVTAILAAHVFFNLAVVVRTVGSAWAALDPRLDEAARTLGASRARTFLTVTLPALRPALLSAAAIVFLFCFTSYGVVLILGAPTRATLETEIYRYAITRLDLPTATALAVVQLATVVAVLGVGSRLGRGSGAGTGRLTGAVVGRTLDTRRPFASGRDRLLGTVVVVVTLCYLALPLASLVIRSFTADGRFTVEHYRALADPLSLLPVTPLAAMVNSLEFAVVAAGVAVLVGGAAALAAAGGGRPGRVVDVLVVLPLGVSAVTIGLGMLIGLDEPPLDLRSSWWIVPLAHAVVGAALVLRIVVPALRAVGRRVHDVASTLGASPGRLRLTVDLPIAARAVAVGASFAFAVSLGEFGATSFLARRPDQLTAPLAIYRLLSRPGETLQGRAAALGVVLMVATLTVVVVADRWAERRGGWTP